MLFYLLSSDELLAVFGRLGYRFAPERIPETVDYYLARTSEGSKLSALSPLSGCSPAPTGITP